MCGEQSPVHVRAAVHQRSQDGLPPTFVHPVCGLPHSRQFACDPRGRAFKAATSGDAVVSVYRSGGVAVQVASVAGKGDQVCH
jgi:hypothetical protein